MPNIQTDVELKEDRLVKGQKNILDEILNKRIKYGEAQFKLSLPLFILMFTEGCQSVVISLLLPQLQKDWGITKNEKSLLITIIYLGVGLGSFVQSWADEYGRLQFIKWNAILQTIFGLLSCIATDINWFIGFRFAYGIGIGIVLPISGTYISEITPTEFRAMLVAKSRIYWSFGCLFTFIFGWYLLKLHHWRLLLLVICVPGIYALIQIYRTGRQTLRYLWAKNRSEQVYELTTYMCQINQQPVISRQQIEYLMSIKEEKTPEVSYKDIFNNKYRSITLKMMVAWFSACFIYYGIFLLLPSILARNHATSYDTKYLALIIINIFELLSFFFGLPMIDSPTFGRKRTMWITFLVITGFSFLLTQTGESNTPILLISLLMIRMAIAINAVTIIPYTIEIYSTLIRSKGMGICAVVGRFGSVVLGFVGLNALYWFNGNGLYFIFMGMGMVSAFAIYKMPFCTIGRALDS